MRLGPAQPPEFVAALEMLFAHVPASDAADRIAAAQALLETTADQPVQLLVARQGHAIVGATLMQVLAGATGVIWPPRATTAEIENALVRESLTWLRANGAKLAQSILAKNEAFLGDSLVRNGFQHPSQLTYLLHDLRVVPKPAGGFEPVDDDNRAVFEAALWRSFEQTRDFPEVNYRRTLEEVLRGHQSAGFDPGNWWLLREAAEPVGVLLLAKSDEERTLELAYLGVVPNARRRGWGRALTRQAIARTKAAGASELTVCVDARNVPARRLYDEMGFVEYDRREVFLALWEAL